MKTYLHKHVHSFSLLALLAGIIVCHPAGAKSAKQAAPQYAKRYALVIGISEYKEFPALPVAVGDATTVAGVAKKKGYDKVVLLTNAEATRENISKEMDAIRSVLKKDDLFALFFAGHGQRVATKNGEFEGYLLPPGCRKAHVAEDGFPLHTIKDAIERLASKHVIILIDACYSGFLADSIAEADKAGELTHNVRVFTAADDDQYAFEAGKHGLFTQYLLKATSKPASLTPQQTEKAAAKVTKAAKAETGGWQTPRFVNVGAHKLRVSEKSYR
jgi:uncharacterized caspase-like protein